MKPGARFSAAISILDIILDGEPVTKALINWFRKNRFAGSKDRFAIRELVFNCIRFKRSSHWPFLVSGFPETGRTLIIGSILRNSGDELKYFGVGRFSPSELTQEEKKVIKLFSQMLEKAPGPIKFDFPDFIEEQLIVSLGDDYNSTISCLNSRASLYLRVNLLKCNIKQALDLLRDENIVVEKSLKVANCIRVLNPNKRIENLTTYKSGKVEIQDLSSQEIINFIDPGEGLEILDFCAGGGGKTLAMAAHTNLKSKFFIHDSEVQRLKDFKKRAARAGVFAEVLSTDALNSKKLFFDIVLSDVPCSGTGAWRRNPSGKWWLTKQKLNELILKQRDILIESSRFLKDGGVLAYVTCSILNVENRLQIDWFLSLNKCFILLKERLISPLEGGDGFYIALLEKSKK